jgi:hypothetical protein
VPRRDLREAVHDIVTIDNIHDYEAAVMQLLASERSYSVAWMQIAGAGAAGSIIGLAALSGVRPNEQGQLFWLSVAGIALLLVASVAWGAWMVWDAMRFRSRLPEAIDAIKVLRP